MEHSEQIEDLIETSSVGDVAVEFLLGVVGKSRRRLPFLSSDSETHKTAQHAVVFEPVLQEL